MRSFYRYYLITTQIIAFMLAPPLIAYVLCKRYNATYQTLMLTVVFSAIIGIILAVLFSMKVFIKLEKKEGFENREK